MRPRLSIGLSLLALAASVAPARADHPAGAAYVGASAGGDLVLRDWDLGDEDLFGDDNRRILPGSSFLLHLRGGYHLLGQLTLEVAAGWLPVPSDHDGGGHAFELGLDVTYHLLRGKMTPFVVAGAGGYLMTGPEMGTDLDPQVHAGAGLRLELGSRLALRVEARDVVSDGFTGTGSNNLELLGGIDLYGPWPRKKEAPRDDRDADGVKDAKDRCPDLPGPPALQGCPDGDGDGLADPDDRCPDTRGLVEFKGCKDRDGDKIADLDDACPDAAGLPELGGCPDRDADGLADGEDKCPDKAGPPDTEGCPDRDRDSILDDVDRCPDEPGTAAMGGCPDRDGDKIVDGQDRCPDQAGMPEFKGCLPPAVAKFAGAIEGIQFETDKATILKRSFKTLDRAAKVLAEYPTLRVRVEGHTDSMGDAAHNAKLSEARAASVKDYLVSKGIDAARIDTAGFGDTKPRAPNKTARGRAKNRRIEFVILTP